MRRNHPKAERTLKAVTEWFDEKRDKARVWQLTWSELLTAATFDAAEGNERAASALTFGQKRLLDDVSPPSKTRHRRNLRVLRYIGAMAPMGLQKGIIIILYDTVLERQGQRIKIYKGLLFTCRNTVRHSAFASLVPARTKA
jgi:hypothetical protein